VGLETSIEALTAVLLAQHSSTAAVTNDIGAVVGVISTADLLAIAQIHELAGATARQLMHGPSSMLPETASLATAAAVMAVEGSNELPIACSACESICVLSSLDILSWLGQHHRHQPEEHALHAV
jgi:predicted transcriptional regulator